MMHKTRLLVKIFFLFPFLIAGCEERFEDLVSVTEKRDCFLIIGETTGCFSNKINKTFEANDYIDFDQDSYPDFQYIIDEVYEDCQLLSDPACNPDSGCNADCWPTIYADFIINNTAKYQINVNENGYPLMLAPGDTISHENKWSSAEINLLYRKAYSNSVEKGFWIEGQYGYLGLREIIVPDTLYAWIKMTTQADNLKLSEFAKMK